MPVTVTSHVDNIFLAIGRELGHQGVFHPIWEGLVVPWWRGNPALDKERLVKSLIAFILDCVCKKEHVSYSYPPMHRRCICDLVKRLKLHRASRNCELLWWLGVLHDCIYQSEHREETRTCDLYQWNPKSLVTDGVWNLTGHAGYWNQCFIDVLVSSTAVRIFRRMRD